MTEIVINTCYGGFGLSKKAEKMLNIPDDGKIHDLKRDDPELVRIVKELGEEANGDFADLQIVNIPDDVEWEIAEYDGTEWVAEKHRTWY